MRQYFFVQFGNFDKKLLPEFVRIPRMQVIAVILLPLVRG